MYEFSYDYVKPKYSEKAKLRYMDKYSFIVHMKTEDIYKDIAKDVVKMFNNSDYKLERRLPKRQKQKSHWFNER